MGTFVAYEKGEFFMKKRLVTVVLMICLALSLIACGKSGSGNDTENNNTENTQQDDEQVNKDTEENVDDGKIEYKVTLVDAYGKAIAGQMIQVCNAATSFTPVATDDNGVAVFRLEESNEYKAKLMTAPENAYKYFEGKTELTIVIEE